MFMWPIMPNIEGLILETTYRSDPGQPHLENFEIVGLFWKRQPGPHSLRDTQPRKFKTGRGVGARSDVGAAQAGTGAKASEA
jgi:hypothetical protein